MTVRAFALCHVLWCPPPLSDCPHCFVIHRRESSPLYFPQSTSLPRAQLPSPPPPPPSSIVHPNPLIAPSCRHYHLLCIANSPPPPPPALPPPSLRSRRAFDLAAAALSSRCFILIKFQLTLLIGIWREKEREVGRISVMLGAARKSNRCTKIRRRTECTPPDVSLHHEIIPSSLEAVGCGVGGEQRCSKRSAATTAIGLFSSP